MNGPLDEIAMAAAEKIVIDLPNGFGTVGWGIAGTFLERHFDRSTDQGRTKCLLTRNLLRKEIADIISAEFRESI